VLVCDDEPAVQRVMARALRAAGYRVIDASGPEEAEALVLTATDPIDLLITDVVMPQMSGPELARRVRESLGEVPVLFVSGHTRDLLEERGLEGRAEFLAKPFTVAALVERVAALVARSLPPRPAGK
jgi:two-component system cell cycle sensor histidine kinase/response regulator CckA